MQSRRAHYIFQHKYGPSRLDGPTTPLTVSYVRVILGAKPSVAREPQPEVQLRIPTIEEFAQVPRRLTTPSPEGVPIPAAKQPLQLLCVVAVLQQETPEDFNAME
ncbi:hypothetical protein BS17DRAFT_555290 [Gyrodon lividus]|nr:hypothetical protein BS17DRAFT_555290 [Gyrodon lividus]